MHIAGDERLLRGFKDIDSFYHKIDAVARNEYVSEKIFRMNIKMQNREQPERQFSVFCIWDFILLPEVVVQQPLECLAVTGLKIY